MVLLCVPQQIPSLAELHGTLSARERFIIRVYALAVQIHLVVQSEASLTNGTLERFLPGMNSLVLDQDRTRSKPRLAYIAMKGVSLTMRAFVDKEGGLLLERLATVLALERADSRVDILMLLEVCRIGKCRAAFFTRKGLDFVMKLFDVSRQAGLEAEGFLA